jgi:hypothetical protein
LAPDDWRFNIAVGGELAPDDWRFNIAVGGELAPDDWRFNIVHAPRSTLYGLWYTKDISIICPVSDTLVDLLRLPLPHPAPFAASFRALFIAKSPIYRLTVYE